MRVSWEVDLIGFNSLFRLDLDVWIFLLSKITNWFLKFPLFSKWFVVSWPRNTNTKCILLCISFFKYIFHYSSPHLVEEYAVVLAVWLVQYAVLEESYLFNMTHFPQRWKEVAEAYSTMTFGPLKWALPGAALTHVIGPSTPENS